MAVSVPRPCLGLCRQRRLFGAKSGLVVALTVFFDCSAVFRFHRTAPRIRTTLNLSEGGRCSVLRRRERALRVKARHRLFGGFGLEPGAHGHPYNKSFIYRRKDRVWAQLAPRGRALRVFLGESRRDGVRSSISRSTSMRFEHLSTRPTKAMRRAAPTTMQVLLSMNPDRGSTLPLQDQGGEGARPPIKKAS